MTNETRVGNRWIVALAGTALQMCLGTVYAWSVFQKPLVANFHWSQTWTAMTFSLAIVFLGLAAAAGGMQLGRFGPRKLAVTGGALFGAGYLVAAFALSIKSLPLLYLGYGVIGGVGLGLGYVTPVATAAKWFPDKKGLVTGMVVMGFGFGALLMSLFFAPMLMKATHGNLVAVFAWLGVILGTLAIVAALFLRNPPAGYVPAGYVPRQAPLVTDGLKEIQKERSAADSIFSSRFAIMWLVFFCNITAGIAMVSFTSPLMQEVWVRAHPPMNATKEALAAYWLSVASIGATLVAISSLFNGIGRFFWGAVSDRIGRAQTFQTMLASQVLVFTALMVTHNPILFAVLICYILLCYGGGFGTMPSFVLDAYGPKRMPVMYGTILTAWSAGGFVGPLIIGFLKDHFASQASYFAFLLAAGVLIIGLVLSTALSNETERGAGRA